MNSKRKVREWLSLRGIAVAISLVMVGELAMQSKRLYAQANGPWGSSQIEVSLVLQSGLSVSAWHDGNRSDETNHVPALMTAVGDGTYQYKTNLVPTAQYNYLFGARPVGISTWGFTPGTTYWEPVPNSGSDAGTFISTMANGSLIWTANGSVGYGTAAGDGRRVLSMPDLTTGDTIYIFNNFASTPRGVANYTIAASSSVSGGKVTLQWRGCLGSWGNGTPSMDCLGGAYSIFRATGLTTSHPVILSTKLAGTATFYVDTNVPETIWYYYIIAPTDSYKNIVNPSTKVPFAQLARVSPVDGTSWVSDEFNRNDKAAKPAAAVPVIFKVEGGDEEYIFKNGGIVYLTPWTEDGRVYPYKIQGQVVRVKMPSGS